MSSGEANNIVWKRSNNPGSDSEEEEEEDVWDDRALISAYDKAMSKVNAVIADKTDKTDKIDKTDKTDKVHDKSLVDNLNTKTKQQTAPTSQQQQKQQSRKTKREFNKEKIKWHVGSYCRAIFSEDNIEYDAQITAINTSNETCIVQYIGYGNEEEKSLHEIKPSLGRLLGKSQIPYDDGNSDSDHDVSTGHDNNRKTGMKKRNISDHNEIPPWFTSSSLSYISKMPCIPPHPLNLPPPPPPPPSNHHHHHSQHQETAPPHVPDLSSIPNEEEALASMLMSWYMSGYHTGYYQALKQSKLNCNCQH